MSIGDIGAKLDQVLLGQDRLERMLLGTPDAPEKGMVVRMDRIEQTMKSFMRVFGFLSACLASAISGIAIWFWKKAS